METSKQTTKEYFKTLSVVHIALIIGIVFFGLITSILIISGKNSNGQEDEIFEILFYMVPIFSIIGYFGSNYFYKTKLAALRKINDLKIKMTEYRGAMIMRYAFIEGPAFFAIVAALITNNLIFLLFAAMMVLIMVLWRPTKNAIIADLELSMQEVDIIEDTDAVIAEFTNTRSY